jgi:hypothetical protein
MVNIKLRLTSFFTGFAVAGALCMWQIRQDVLKSSEFLAAQVRLPMHQMWWDLALLP